MRHRSPRSVRTLCATVSSVLVGALLLVPPSASAAAPSNDSFAAAIDLGSALPAVGQGSNIDATTEANEPTSRGPFVATGTVWWKWTAPATGRFRVDMCDTLPSMSASLAVFTGGSVGTLTNVGAVGSGRTDAPAPYPGGECVNANLQAAAFDAVVGTTYRFAAGGTGSATSTNIVLRVTRPAPNDNFASATDLGSAVPAVGAASNIGASTEVNEPVQRGVFGATGTIWWRWTAPATGRYRVDMCDTLPSLAGSLAVFTGSSVGVLTGVAAVGSARTSAPSPYPGGDCDNANLPAVAFDAVAGTTYSFAAGGAGGSTSSNVVLRVARPAPNDNFASATDLGSAVPAVGVASNIGASTEVNEPVQRGVFGATGTIWWRWTAPATGRYRVDMCATLPALTATLAVYTGTVVSALADATTLGTSRTPATQTYPGGQCSNTTLQAAAFDAVAGMTYSFAAGGAGGSASPQIQLNVSLPGSAAPPPTSPPTSPPPTPPGLSCTAATTAVKAALGARVKAQKKAKAATGKAKAATKKARTRPSAKNKAAAVKARAKAKKAKARAKAAATKLAAAKAAQTGAC